MPRVAVAGALSLIIVSVAAWLMLGPSSSDPLVELEPVAEKVVSQEAAEPGEEPAAASSATSAEAGEPVE